MKDIYSIEGKVAVVTGAAGVLGGSLARHFAAQGAKVAALVHRPEQVDEVLSVLGPGHLAFACDVMDVKALEEISAAVVKAWGRVDILLNVAATCPEPTLCRTSTSTI